MAAAAAAASAAAHCGEAGWSGRRADRQPSSGRMRGAFSPCNMVARQFGCVSGAALGTALGLRSKSAAQIRALRAGSDNRTQSERCPPKDCGSTKRLGNESPGERETFRAVKASDGAKV